MARFPFVAGSCQRLLASVLVVAGAAEAAEASVYYEAQIWAPPVAYPGYDVGYRSGYDAAFAPAFEGGKVRGVTVGTTEGSTQGRAAGYAVTYQPTFDAFYPTQVESGFASGYVFAYPYAYNEAFQRGVAAGRPVWQSGWSGGSSSSSSVIITAGWNPNGFNGADYTVWRDALGVGEYDRGVNEGSSAGRIAGDAAGYAQTYPGAFEAAFAVAEPAGRAIGVFEGAYTGASRGYSDAYNLGYTGAIDDASLSGYQEGWNAVFGIASDSQRDAWMVFAPEAAAFYDPRASINLGAISQQYAVNMGMIPEPTSAMLVATLALFASGRRRNG
ncbi:MAG: hypothetical protein ACRCT8_10580 [Lacipirellulaceae bacterium]